MLKLEIKFDEIKMQSDHSYTSESVYKTLDNIFLKYDFHKEILEDGTVSYSGNGMSCDYAIFGRLITKLKDEDWFMRYLVKWLWYNSDDGENESDFAVEDILYHYAKRESAA